MPRKTDILRPLTIPSLFATINEQLAGLAHPVERLLPKQQAAGSGPVPCSKTNGKPWNIGLPFCLQPLLQNTKGLCHDLCSPAALLQMQNSYSGNEYGLRYRMIPGKRTVPDPDGGEGAAKEESILTVDYWPDPGPLKRPTLPCGCRRCFRSPTRAGRPQPLLQDAFNADPDRWKNCPSMMDSDPWEPPAAEAEPDKPKE